MAGAVGADGPGRAVRRRAGLARARLRIYFDGDPLVSGTIEGPIPKSSVKTTQLHDDPADYQARGLQVPYRTLTFDYVLRPVPTAAVAGAVGR
ncbi:hypothetical protein [Promicromonospora sp. NPDC050262]|uniref:hypothetical protein n=1 Tax=Promicromonospora sp. NPDC050262 TaxID=3155036 RepID=UPI0033DE33F0